MLLEGRGVNGCGMSIEERLVTGTAPRLAHGLVRWNAIGGGTVRADNMTKVEHGSCGRQTASLILRKFSRSNRNLSEKHSLSTQDICA
jgi:hypothetical protein